MTPWRLTSENATSASQSQDHAIRHQQEADNPSFLAVFEVVEPFSNTLRQEGRRAGGTSGTEATNFFGALSLSLARRASLAAMTAAVSSVVLTMYVQAPINPMTQMAYPVTFW
eukprot:CAMPEP_0174699042 /NCGR_PEP_ID=MMETSP1094-20130205/4446_1 /TAXON_ID=156173 /ORGANISM="Chrysochromulina brevifilum, Strain UTEX LB 985" /LENGTH=112 /DNA_ID=CAMNT_0015896303 /DNA_START=82 /DNA_END=418 /DNA_ORIENTATION=-